MKKIIMACMAIMGSVSLVTAQSGCINPPTVVIAATTTTVCQGEFVTLSASGADSYTWTNNVASFVPFAPSVSTTYQVIGTDAAGCSDTVEVFIEVLPLPNVVANATSHSICLGESIVLEATGAQSYAWDEPTITDGAPYTPQSTGTNNYVVEGTDANGCTNTSQVLVLVRPAPTQPFLSTSAVATCLNDAVEPIVASVDAPEVRWFSDAQLSDQVHLGPDLRVQTNAAGIQRYYAVARLDGCSGPAATVTVDVSAGPMVNAGLNIRVRSIKRIFFNATADEAASLEWSPAEGLSDPTSPTTDFLATTTQEFTLTATDANGCQASDTVLVTVPDELVVSNVITPNGDGNNDVWRMYPDELRASCTVRLFDGFGRLLLETNNYQNDWDGTFEGKNLPDGDYYYHIQSDGIDQKGTLVIIR